VGSGFEVELLLERQRDSKAAPVWHADTVSLMMPSLEVRTSWNGLEVILYWALVAATRKAIENAVFILDDIAMKELQLTVVL
jgi:hypothetical protein